MCARPMQIGGVYIDSQQLLEILGVVGGIGLTGLFGLLLVRRARATRLRQIEGLEAGERPAAGPARRRLRAEDLEDDDETQAHSDEDEAASRGPGATPDD